MYTAELSAASYLYILAGQLDPDNQRQQGGAHMAVGILSGRVVWMGGEAWD